MTLVPGDIVALDENGELIKAETDKAAIGIVMGDPSMGTVVRAIKNGYVVDVIVRADTKKASDQIGKVLRAMNADPHLDAAIRSRINSASNHQEDSRTKVRDAASRALGVALNDALAGDMAKVILGTSNAPKITFPPPPLPSIPMLGLQSSTPSIDATKEAEILFDQSGKRLFWLGLLRQDGREVQVPEYDRQSIEIDIQGSSIGVKFPAAASDWGVITHIGLYEKPDASTPMLTFPTNAPTCVSSGTVLNVNDVKIRTSPIGLAPGQRLHLGLPKVAEEEREPLKNKMEEARLRLKGLVGS